MASDKDDFWDISKLLPKKKNTLSPFSTKENVVDFEIIGDEVKKPSVGGLVTELPKREENSTTYSVSNGFLRSVTITRFTDKYDFYGNFRKAALLYYDYKTPKCEFVPFYSYMPQYSQLNSQQKNFYFYWRDCVRRGKYIKTDYSYFYLYIYEILNLPDKISPEDGIELLITLWRAYRIELPNIDINMSLWLQDYCLVYNMPCPTEKISDFIFDIIGAASFKEFYLADAKSLGADGVGAMIAYLSDYDWRRGKYAGGDNREAYAKHLLGAMDMLINRLWQSGAIISAAEETALLTRNAFQGSLCTHSVKCRLSIEYIPLSRAESLRRAVTAAVRYTENKLRALIGVKSRLAVKELPDEYRAVIDGYFSGEFDRVNRERARAAMPEYEKLYDAESETLSIEGADEIERASWSTTARLVPEDSEPDSDIKEQSPDVPEAPPEQAASTDTVDKYGLADGEIEFLRAVNERDRERIIKLSDALGVLPDALAERINEAFADGFGDVIIEGEAPELNIIEDYEEDIKEWLLKITR